jgi:hypothetical protein
MAWRFLGQGKRKGETNDTDMETKDSDDEMQLGEREDKPSVAPSSALWPKGQRACGEACGKVLPDRQMIHSTRPQRMRPSGFPDIPPQSQLICAQCEAKLRADGSTEDNVEMLIFAVNAKKNLVTRAQHYRAATLRWMLPGSRELIEIEYAGRG